MLHKEASTGACISPNKRSKCSVMHWLPMAITNYSGLVNNPNTSPRAEQFGMFKLTNEVRTSNNS